MILLKRELKSDEIGCPCSGWSQWGRTSLWGRLVRMCCCSPINPCRGELIHEQDEPRSTFYTPIGYVMLMYELEPLKQLWSYGLKIVIRHNSRPVWPQTACEGTHSFPIDQRQEQSKDVAGKDAL
jgi:hypothetical protein